MTTGTTSTTSILTEKDLAAVEKIAMAFGGFDAADTAYYGSFVATYAQGCLDQWYGDQRCGYGAYRVSKPTAQHAAIKAAIIARITELTPAAVAAGFTRGAWLSDVLAAAATARG